uniref:PUM-HD domain-containing protein n=1 Tax=Arcella intermedia TaxID=1963864 RepID=A0A6B2L0M7_9EUKA
MERKMAKPHGEARIQIKRLWADLGKKKDTTKTQQSITEMLSLMEDGKLITEFAMKRDLSRIIQSILKYGTQEQRDVVQENLKEHVVELSKNNYAYYLVMKLLYYGTKEQRSAIIEKFYGRVRQLVRHKNASNVVETAYITYANSAQKKSLLEEFYGPEYSLFKSGEKHTLQEILNANPIKKPTILNFLKNYLFDLTNKPDILRNSIVHKPLLQYMELAKDSDKAEMAGFMSDHLKTFLHSKDGARAAVMCIQYAPLKERKMIVKSFKGYVKKICMEQYGHWVIISVFKFVDDTVLVSKLILKEMQQHTKELLLDKYGRLAFLAIIKGVVVPYFPPQIVKFMEPKLIDDPQNPGKQIATTKKLDEKRKEELLQNLLIDFTNAISNAEAIYDFVTNENAADVIKELFDHISVEVQNKLLDLILSWVDFTPQEERKYHPMEKKPEPKVNIVTHPVGRVFLSRLIKNHPTLADKVMDKLKPKLLDYAKDANGSWVVLRLLQNPSSKDTCKKLLLPAKEDLSNQNPETHAPILEELKK